MPMTTVLAVLLVLVAGAAGILWARQQAAPQPIAQAPQPQIDVNALIAAVSTQVEATMRRTAQENLTTTNQQTQMFFESQSKTLDEKTAKLMQPFASQMEGLSKAVSDLKDTYTGEQKTVEGLFGQIATLQQITTSLSNALKSPTARGSWGENQLRNVIQLAGMEPFCDYTEQFTGGEAERVQRPDVVMKLPNGAFLAIDSKAPLAAYQRMQAASDLETKEAELKLHAKSIREHVKALADKKYWEQFPTAPEFVVMFIPGEGFVSDAVRSDPTLIEDAMRSRVLIASPVNLLALLLAVAKGWQAHKIAEHADQVARLGAEVYDRTGKVLEQITRMGNAIKTTNTAYNDMVGSVESRLLVTLRKFRELGVVQTEISDVKPLEVAPRELSAPELPRELGE